MYNYVSTELPPAANLALVLFTSRYRQTGQDLQKLPVSVEVYPGKAFSKTLFQLQSTTGQPDLGIHLELSE